ncbi:MAG: bifunctional adenosylcobinamide kinase/adenosylcobinamide-phosphate guanylyltransferase, partial [Acidimicrobiales bacterium]
MITLVLGGSRSGKSEVAERLASRRSDNGPVTFVATAVVDGTDPDFAARIDAHRRRRPAAWTTVEAGAELVAAIRTAPGQLLIDSLGTWVAAAPEFAVDVNALVDALRERAGR